MARRPRCTPLDEVECYLEDEQRDVVPSDRIRELQLTPWMLCPSFSPNHSGVCGVDSEQESTLKGLQLRRARSRPRGRRS